METIVKVLYETISGPAGTEGYRKRFRSLLFPCASLVRMFLSAESAPGAQAMDAHAYEADSVDYFFQE
jgi:hypothetical protein